MIFLHRPDFFRLIVLSVLLLQSGCASSESPGFFEGTSDIGEVQIPGSAACDAGTESCRVTGSGANIWGTEDQFHFVWKRLAGDLRLQAFVEFEGTGGDPHRKAGLMIRSDLTPDSPYVDAMVHGDGLVSMQYREVPGGETREVAAYSRGPLRIRLERTDQVFTLFVEPEGGTAEPVGSIVVDLPELPYVGLAVCSHDPERSETALFSRLDLLNRIGRPEEERVVESSLETLEVSTGRRRLIYQSRQHFEAPNWSRDGSYFLFNQEGRLYTLPVSGGTPKELDTGFADNCNNDHGFSPDGERLAISHSPAGESLIYVLPSVGGEPRLVTEEGPSYWHGWSPDGSTLAYTARRDGEFDIYTIPVTGGVETRLTTAEGLDDGPDYSSDGRYIYINSERSGLMKIWRITPDGETQEQVTFDNEYADWFPHPSPDGESMVLLSYDRGVEGHPPNREVVLRMMPLAGGQPRVVAHLFGGQGTINVPSWSPDASQFAFVSYRQVLPGW